MRTVTTMTRSPRTPQRKWAELERAEQAWVDARFAVIVAANWPIQEQPVLARCRPRVRTLAPPVVHARPQHPLDGRGGRARIPRQRNGKVVINREPTLRVVRSARPALHPLGQTTADHRVLAPEAPEDGCPRVS